MSDIDSASNTTGEIAGEDGPVSQDSFQLSNTLDTSLINGWLLLRQAENLADSVGRASLYVKIKLAVARDRIPWVEAKALENVKNYEGAIEVYRRLDAPLDVFRLSAIKSASDSAASEGIRLELLEFIASSNNSAAKIIGAIRLFDSMYRAQSLSDHLTIAKAASDLRMHDRAVNAYSAADKVEELGWEQRSKYAAALYGLRQFQLAAREYAKITAPRSAAAAARYQRARASVAMGRTAQGRSQLRAIDAAYPADSSAAAANYLLADLLSDEGNEREARQVLRNLVERFPSNRFSASARMEIALSSFVLKDYEAASRELSELLKGAPSSSAEYWLARTDLEMGDTTRGYQRLSDLLRRDSLSYYGVLAARRLNIPNIRFSAGEVEYPSHPSVDSALSRIVVLKALNMNQEIGYEYSALFNLAGSDKNRLLATAAAFAGTSQAGRAIALGRQALSRFGGSKDIYRLIYPVNHRETILENAISYGVDPIVVASLIRQESNFNPGAVSPVGALGLMQLMPNVAAEIARKKGIRSWSSRMLYDPGLNIDFGISHLAPLIKKQPNIVRALAAYNAGGSRVTRWSRKAGSADAEVFGERIPIQETKGYVRNILTNREFYRALYTW